LIDPPRLARRKLLLQALLGNPDPSHFLLAASPRTWPGPRCGVAALRGSPGRSPWPRWFARRLPAEHKEGSTSFRGRSSYKFWPAPDIAYNRIIDLFRWECRTGPRKGAWTVEAVSVMLTWGWTECRPTPEGPER